PSAAITSDTIAQECDFLSIGTNDLIQYTLAADRDNQSIEKYYLPHHPSIIKLIKMTVQNAHEKGIKVAICGEMASQPEFVPLLLGLGIDELSVSPGLLLKIKDIILHCDMRKNLKLAENILQQKTHKDIEKILKEKKG
ncbi:MAG: phosphoenolpyruvate--protein phosphotransferase, partial [Candidatus Cloacimonetes bacterium]|nr:phosphoenolpyruvate--protein phosphotransferase [Candidatus Cloacimonadota bacterium]